MQFVRFRDPAGSIRHGQWHDDGVTFGANEYSLDAVDVLAPTTPSKIICVGLNYADHAAEVGADLPDRPRLFMKGPNAVTGYGDEVTLPAGKERVDHECELGVVIGQQCRDVSVDDAWDVVRGFTCGNDLSNRDDQRIEQNWVRGKAFDNAAPMGPTIAPPSAVPADAGIRLRVNGETRQESSRDQLVFTVPDLVAEITQYVTLEAGDVIFTGTPSGVSPLEDGDDVEIEIDGIPPLRHSVRIPDG